MRPVMRGLIPYTALIDGTVDLGDVARMNDAIDVDLENQRRADEAARRKK